MFKYVKDNIFGNTYYHLVAPNEESLKFDHDSEKSPETKSKSEQEMKNLSNFSPEKNIKRIGEGGVMLFHDLKDIKATKHEESKIKKKILLLVLLGFMLILIFLYKQEDENEQKVGAQEKDWFEDNIEKDEFSEIRLKSTWHYKRYRESDFPRIKACLITPRPIPQKYSLYISNYLSNWGGEIEWYLDHNWPEVLKEYYDLGQIDRKLFKPKIYSYNGKNECPPSWPRLWLTIKSESVHKLNSSQYMAPKIQTGDEKCAHRFFSVDSPTRLAFRQYYIDDVIEKIAWIPLGPRFEWVPVTAEESIPINERTISWNFQGTITSASRRKMVNIFKDSATKRKYPWIKDGACTYKYTWSKFVSKKRFNNKGGKGYNDPRKYRNIMLNSVFTMIPVGNAPESFRIYEAIDAASIPVMSLDKSYTSHMCNNAFRPFIDSGAPFLYVNDWSEAVEKMDHLLKNKNLLEKMQLDLIKWRAEFWNNVTTKLECEVMTYFDKYRQDAVFLNNQSIHGKVDLKRFCGKRKLPRFPSYFSTVKN